MSRHSGGNYRQYYYPEYSDVRRGSQSTTSMYTDDSSSPSSTSSGFDRSSTFPEDTQKFYQQYRLVAGTDGNRYWQLREECRHLDLPPYIAYAQSGNDSELPAQFVCLTRGCESLSAFKRKADLNRHYRCVHLDFKGIDCPHPDCKRKGSQAFSRIDHAREHIRNYHHEAPEKYDY